MSLEDFGLELPGMEGIDARRRESRRRRIQEAEDELVRLLGGRYDLLPRVSNRKLHQLRKAIDKVLEARS